MSAQNFLSMFLDRLRPGDRVLDIGGGDGTFAEQFVERGATVTIVDPKATRATTSNIVVRPIAVETYCADLGVSQFQAVFARNVIQFLDSAWVFSVFEPWLTTHVVKDGVVAIKTFYRDPEPPFVRPVSSLYLLADLQHLFLQWTELYAAQYDHRGLDMQGHTRFFFTTDLIVQR